MKIENHIARNNSRTRRQRRAWEAVFITMLVLSVCFAFVAVWRGEGRAERDGVEMTSANSKNLPANRARNLVPAAYKFSELINVLTDMNATKTLRVIAEKFSKSGVKISHATIQRVIAGKEPKRNAVRRALGLSTIRLVRANPPTRWRDLPLAELRRALVERVEYKL